MKARLAAAVVLGLALSVYAETRLAHIFQDNMVLQRDVPVPVWGWADAGATVEVEFAGQKKQATANDKGYWKVALDPLPADRTGQVLTMRSGATLVERKNILVGEVWVAAGQSNMVHAGPDKDTGVYPHYVSPGTAGGKPEIRMTPFGWGAELSPMDDIDPAGRSEKSWETMKENPAADTMGPSYYFARVVRDELDVPVGIIRVAVPGTTQTAWMDKATLESFPGENGDANFYETQLKGAQDRVARQNGPIKSWEDMKKAEAEWRAQPRGRTPAAGLAYANFPTALYNTRIHPLAPFAFRGVIWHQGEAGPGGAYGDRMAAMVRQWRSLFGHDFYFIFGTLSRSTDAPPPLSPARSSFYRSNNNNGIRAGLKAFAGDTKVEMVELYDVGNEETHFLQKAEAGRRYGLAALALAYGKATVFTGPRVADIKIDGGRATIRFTHVGEGLKYEPSIDGISGFYLRGKSGAPQWGEVKVIDKETIEVSHPAIAEIATVGYACNVNPHETLFNSAGLPASPFLHADTNTRDAPGPIQLLAFDGKRPDVVMQIAHVRRSGYVFQLKQADSKVKPNGPAKLIAYIPSEWNGFEVESNGTPLKTESREQNGKRLITFEAPVDEAWIIIAERGKAADLRKVNRY